MGGLDEEVKNQKEETKIVDLDEEKNKAFSLLDSRRQRLPSET